jgi:hypothetical protein
MLDELLTISSTLSPDALASLLAYARKLAGTDQRGEEPAGPEADAGQNGTGNRGYVEIKTIKGRPYAYRRWREGKVLRSEYLGKVKS